MDYVDDPQEIEVNVRALEKIKEWADEQALKLRKPLGARRDEPPQDEPADAGLGDLPADDEHSQFAGDEAEPDGDEDEPTVLSISRPGDRAPKMPMPMDDEKTPVGSKGGPDMGSLLDELAKKKKRKF